MKRFLIFTLVVLALAAPAAAQEAVPVEVVDLLDSPEAYQGTVAVTGELIGDYGIRTQGMWTQLNGDSYVSAPVLDGGGLTGGNYGIAVRIPLDLAGLLEDPPGGYRVRGPVVEIVGEWRYHDPKSGGETYLDVVALSIVEPGHTLSEHPNYWLLVAGLILIAAALMLHTQPFARRRKKARRS